MVYTGWAPHGLGTREEHTGRQAYSTVQQNTVWAGWCAGTERAARQSEATVRASRATPPDPRVEGPGDYGLLHTHQLDIEPQGETRLGRALRVRSRLAPIETRSFRGASTISYPRPEHHAVGGWPPPDPQAAGTSLWNDGFHTTSALPGAAGAMTRAHRSSLAAAMPSRHSPSRGHSPQRSASVGFGSTRSLSPRRSLSPHGLSRNRSLADDPAREQRVLRLYQEAHRRRSVAAILTTTQSPGMSLRGCL